MKWRIRRKSTASTLLPWEVRGWVLDELSGDWVPIKAHVQTQTAAVEFMDYYERRPGAFIVLGPLGSVVEAPC